MAAAAARMDVLQRKRAQRGEMTRPDWRVALLAAAVLGGCGGGGESAPDPNRQRYEADKKHCESISSSEPAQKSCMTYRGWRDGKYRR